MVAGNGGSSLFPLPSNFFPRLELAHEEARAFQDWGDRMLQETVDAYHRDQLDSREQKERKWKPLKQRGGLTAFRRRKAMGGDDEYRYMTTGVIEGTLDEVVRGRYADNTEDFRRVSAVYREDLVDCAVLHTIEKETETNPFYYAGFKWMTVQSPGKGLVKNRDVCWYEQMGLTHDRNGKEIGYTLTESVDLPNCPIFSDCVRAKLSVCYLYRRNKSGGVKVYMRGKNNAGGKVMEYIADQKSAELWLRVDAAMSVTHAAVATALVECSKGVRRMNFEKKKCEICEDRIGTIMSAAKECAMCHRYTCSRCIVKQRVLSPLVDFKAVCKENFCKKCLRFITQVNLREPQSVHDVWAFATSMSDSSQRSYHHHRIESERSTDSSRDTDDSQQNSSSRTRSVADSVTSDGSDHSFRSMPPPPTISTKATAYTPSSSNNHDSQRSAKPPLKMKPNMDLLQPPLQPQHYHSTASLPAAPVTLYNGAPMNNMSRSVDSSIPRHVPRYMNSPAASATSSHQSGIDQNHSFASHADHDIQYSYPDSTRSHTSTTSSSSRHRAAPQMDYYEGPMTTSITNSSVYSASPRTHTPRHDPSYYTPDAMMAQMIKMNIMAEKAQQLVEENDRLARNQVYGAH